VDAGVDADHAVDQAEVFRVFGENTERLRSMLRDVVTGLPTERDCSCPHALDGMHLPVELPGGQP
jgi:5'-methylthioadenosine phosphorylase